jgi:hypothetical protein
VSALGSHTCCDQTCGPAANHDDVLLAGRHGNLRPLAPDLGVDDASYSSTGFHAGQAALETPATLHDQILLTTTHLVREIRVCDQRPPERDAVDPTFAEQTRDLSRITQATGYHDGYVQVSAQILGQLHVHASGEAHVLVIPGRRVAGRATGDVDRVDPELDQPLAEANGILDAEPAVDLFGSRYPRRDGDAFAHRLTHGCDHPLHEPEPVLGRSTPFVVALVRLFRKELRGQIAQPALHLHAVKTGTAGAARCLAELGDHPLDSLRGHDLWGGAGARTGNRAWGLRLPLRGLGVGGPPGVIDVADGLGSLIVDGIDEPTESIDGIVVRDGELLGVLLAGRDHEHRLDNDGAHASPSAPAVVVDESARDLAVGSAERGLDRRHEEPVAKLQGAQCQRIESVHGGLLAYWFGRPSSADITRLFCRARNGLSPPPPTFSIPPVAVAPTTVVAASPLGAMPSRAPAPAAAPLGIHLRGDEHGGQ